jgi:hypothetical protein
MRVSLRTSSVAVCLTLLSSLTCSDVPAAPEAAAATPPGQDPPTDTTGLSDRELILSVLAKLDALEGRYDTEARAFFNRVDAVMTRVDTVTTSTLRFLSTGESPGNSPGSGNTPPGVPHQLVAIRAQLATLQGELDALTDKIDEITVGIGLPAPPGSDIDESRLFELSQKVCLEIGTQGTLHLEGTFKANTEGKGGAGIDFYGNKLMVDVVGAAESKATARWAILQAGLKYNLCVNPAREEATFMIPSLPFPARDFQARFQTLAGDMGNLRTNPMSVMNPNFNMLGLARYPSRSALLNQLDNFFGGMRSDLCANLKSRFDVVKDLGLGDGWLSNIPTVSSMQGRFNSRC